MRALTRSGVRSATKLSTWNAYIRDSIADFNVAEDNPGLFSGHLFERKLGCASAIYASASSHRVEKRSSAAAPFMLLRYQIAGQTEYLIDGRRLNIKSGEAVVLDPRNTLAMLFPQEFKTLTLKIPRDFIRERAPTLMERTEEPLLRGLPIAPLMVEYLRCFSDVDDVNSCVSEAMLSSFLELLDVSYREGSTAVLGKHARLRREIEAYLNFNFSDSDLSVHSVAKAMSVSVRLLQHIYQQNATTFCNVLMEKRLRFARSLMETQSAQRITDVAYSSGFNDLSYFNRCYKRAFGESPSSTMRAANCAGHDA